MARARLIRSAAATRAAATGTATARTATTATRSATAGASACWIRREKRRRDFARKRLDRGKNNLRGKNRFGEWGRARRSDGLRLWSLIFFDSRIRIIVLRDEWIVGHV